MHGLKLRQKGLLLVCIPLGVQLVFLCVLMQLLFNADAAMKRESESKEVIYTGSNILKHCIECATATAFYNYTLNRGYRDKSIKALESMNEEAASVEGKVHDEDQRRRLAACRSAMKELSAVHARFLDKTEGDRSSLHIFMNNEGLTSERHILAQLTERNEEFIQAERILCDKFVQQKLQARRILVNTTIVGIALDVLVAAAAASYFFKNISLRLEDLINDTRLIKESQIPARQIRGTDEIAQLSQSFQQAVLELQQSEQMRRQIVSMVGHDLRSPLTSIDAALTLINEGVLGAVPQAVLEASTTASQNLGRLVRLTNDLLDAECLASGSVRLERSESSVQSILQQVHHVMEYQCLAHKVSLVTSADDFIVIVDGNRIVQVLCNLVANAIRVSKTGDTVTVTARQLPDVWEFTVTDSGCGIAEDEQESIFERFTRLRDEPDGGRGLGLSICKSLVELHGGTIGVTSRANEGSTFWFKLPTPV
jgi:signal transduction histidine kinase